MKRIFYILIILFCLSSCVNSRYRFQCKTIDNEIICDTIIIVTERFTFKGEDVHPQIYTEQVNCLDTIYMFYYPIIHDNLKVICLDKYKSNTPIYVSKLEYIEE